MLRCRETAAPIADRWRVTPVVEPDIGEIQSPGDHDLATRSAWLDVVLHQTWPELPAEQQAWREALLARLVSLTEDCVVVTHFVAINAAIGAATHDDRVVCRHVDNCSTTTFDTDGRTLTLVDVSGEAERTQVL
jgi:broad specificity phosphatase PhoE